MRATLTAVLIAISLVFVISHASAQEAPTRAERRLIELTAKVSFNEALDSEHDRALIWQVIEGHGDTPAERAYWLERHSPCVGGRLTQDQAYLRPGNCRWSRNLMPDGRRPRGWDRELHGRWSWLRERWIAHVEAVRDLVMGRDPYRPCAETPSTWDGRAWQEQAVERGFRAVECAEGTRNIGYVRAR